MRLAVAGRSASAGRSADGLIGWIGCVAVWATATGAAAAIITANAAVSVDLGKASSF
jgi:hypothetical protein